jgi:hypothetical protein
LRSTDTGKSGIAQPFRYLFPCLRSRCLNLAKLGFCETSSNGFHPVGVIRLSGPALEDGIEWTVKLSEVEAPYIVERFRGAFDSLWGDEEFEQFRPDDEALCRRVKESLEYARQGPGRRDAGPPVFSICGPIPTNKLRSINLKQNELTGAISAT